jgi:hypothetical protein
MPKTSMSVLSFLSNSYIIFKADASLMTQLSVNNTLAFLGSRILQLQKLSKKCEIEVWEATSAVAEVNLQKSTSATAEVNFCHVGGCYLLLKLLKNMFKRELNKWHFYLSRAKQDHKVHLSTIKQT